MVVILFLCMAASNTYIIKRQESQLLAEVSAHTRFELEEAASFLVEPLLKYQFSTVDQFVRTWSESHKDVVSFAATSPTGHLLSSFSRESKSPANQITVSKEISHLGQSLLTLTITKDFTEAENQLLEARNFLFAVSLIIAGILGVMLWSVFRIFALRPLEREIALRRSAENELEAANMYLEDRIGLRTAELQRQNILLEEEIEGRQKLERQLSNEKEQLLVTLRSIGDGVITTDISGRVVLLSKAAEELTGWNQQEARGRSLDEVFHIINEQTGEPCTSPVEKVVATGQIVGLANHTALIDRGGRKRSIADSGAPIRDARSEIIGVVLVFRDITDQVRTEKELLKVKKLESVGVLAGGIAHDFNNILVAILGNINLSLLDTTLDDKTKKFLVAAEKASLRARDLTQQLLTFARGGDPVRVTASLADVVRDSASFVLAGKNVSCRFDIPDDLFSAEIDRGQISQVIQNLVINASHAMPEGGVIRIGCENIEAPDRDISPLLQGSRYVKITMRDSGIGISPQIIDRIFDPYFSTKKEGSGLGLAISHSIISKHGGRIAVQSTPGEGTTFTILLPASPVPGEDAPQEEGVDQALGRRKILVMDDEETVRKVAESMLKKLGHDPVVVDNGAAAVQKYIDARNQGDPFDCVVTDLTIPGGMGGRDACRKILEIDPDARVIVASGYSNDPVMSEHEKFGFSGVLVKPFTLGALEKALASCLK